MPFSGAKLREARAGRMTLAELAESVGVDRQTIYNYEVGTSTPKADALEKMSAALGRPLQYFYQDDDVA
jgi:transcriptional regulator with XRE-family HTH domain